MTGTWWVCRSCGHESYDSVTAFHHTADAGHDGNVVAAAGIGAGPGSSAAARAEAIAATKAAVEDARRRRTTATKETPDA